ncbi:MAG: hypothetical protein GC157_06235 [Frankiales bacterium]|nr:hypothetical protein [Frankiales bacterium]
MGQEGSRLRLTRTAWFGPKRVVGWGWSPRSWQGWAVTAVFLAALVPLAVVPHRPWAGVALLAVYLVVIAVTGDPPGPARHGG